MTDATAPAASTSVRTLHIGNNITGDDDVVVCDQGDTLFATWDGGPQFAIMAYLHKGEWIVASSTGHFDVLATCDKRAAVERLVYNARTWH